MSGSNTIFCPKCGAAMNRHAEKLDRSAASGVADIEDPEIEGDLIEIFACPRCGATASRSAHLKPQNG